MKPLKHFYNTIPASLQHFHSTIKRNWFTKSYLTLMLMMCLKFINIEMNLFAQCPFPVIVGTNVGVPDLATAQALSLIIVVNDEINNQDFCIDGDFDIHYTSWATLKFNNCNINILTNTTVDFISTFNLTNYEFNNCSYLGGANSNMFFQGGNNSFTSCTIVDINNFVQFGGTIYKTTSNYKNILFNVSGGSANINYSHFEDCFWEVNSIMHFVNRNNIYIRQNSTNQLPAVFLKGFGNYLGLENQFLNYETSINKRFSNPDSYVEITEIGSTFKGNGNLYPYIILGQNISSCIIRNCEFEDFVDHAIRIQNGALETLIDSSTFITEKTGLRDRSYLVDVNNATITNNEYTGIQPPQYTTISATDWLADVKTGLVQNNVSINGTNNFGLQMIFCDNVTAKFNSYINNIIGISSSWSNDMLIGKSNFCSESNVGLEIESTSNSIFECNHLIENRDGLNVKTTNPNITIRGNIMEENNRGLVYQQSVNAPPQINQGNWFINNVFGAEFVNASVQQGDNMEYLYDQNSFNNLENPITFSPSNWFKSNRDPSFECGLALESKSDPIYHVEKQVLSLMDCVGYEYTSGDCYSRLYHAWHIVDENQKLLQNEEIALFHYKYSNTSLALFPTWQIMKKAVSISYVDAPQKPEINDWWNPTVEELPVILKYYETMNDYMHAKNQDKANLIDAYQAYLESIFIDSHIESNIKTSLTWLLDKWRSQNPMVELPLNEIQAMASLCPNIAGPGVRMARSIIASLRLPHEFDDLNCTANSEMELSRVIINQNSGNGNEISIFPNPTSDYLNIVVPNKFLIEPYTVFIFNLVGQPVMNFMIQDENNRIDISRLNSGVYLMNSDKFQAAFVKN